MSSGEETDSTSYKERGRNRNIIPQVDGTMDSRDSLDQTLDSIDLTESPVKNINTQRDIEKINEDTSDNDIDEMIDFNKDKARTIYRKDTNDQKKRAKIAKSKKGRTTKVCVKNIEKVIIEIKKRKGTAECIDRKLAKANPLVALQASVRANRASKDTQDIEMTDNAAIDADNTDNAAIDADNTDNATTDGDNTDDAATGDGNTDNTIIGDDNTEDAVTGEDNTDKVITDKASTVHIPLPPCSKGKAKDPSQIKTFSKHTIPIAEPSIRDPLPDNHATVKASGHIVDLSDVRIYEFLIQGAPNPHDSEGIEENQLLELQ